MESGEGVPEKKTQWAFLRRLEKARDERPERKGTECYLESTIDFGSRVRKPVCMSISGSVRNFF